MVPFPASIILDHYLERSTIYIASDKIGMDWPLPEIDSLTNAIDLYTLN